MAHFFDARVWCGGPLTVRRVYRTGVQTLRHHQGQWWIAIRNRTYRSRVLLTEAQARKWYTVLMSSD